MQDPNSAQGTPYARRGRFGRPHDSEAVKARKAAHDAAEKAKTCSSFRVELIKLLQHHNLEIIDLLTILLLKFPGEAEGQPIDDQKNRYVSRWLRGDSALNWPRKGESTIWGLILETLMSHSKNKESYVSKEHQVSLAFQYANDLSRVSTKRSSAMASTSGSHPVGVLSLDVQEHADQLCK